MKEPLIFELSKSGRKGYTLPKLDVEAKPIEDLIPSKLLRKESPHLPELNETEVVRHFVRLSELNYHVDHGFYPLGSCTMKYNPKVNEDVARLPGFLEIHPFQPERTVQGALRLMKELEEYLAEISGMDAVTLQPAAGAHGELTSMMIVRRYHEKQGNPRKIVLIPDSAHGTNPASVTLAGYQAKTIKSNERGLVNIEELKKHLNEDVAAFMVTNPNTLGLFESEIVKISELVHSVGALMYMDGANLNALLGYVRPGDIGFDVMHFNLHKTFSTPHGGGGPGSGPVGVKKHLEPFLPVPRIVEKDGKLALSYDFPDSIGKVHAFYGNFDVMVKAYTYIRMMGPDGLKRVAEAAVINANYLLALLKSAYKVAYDRFCMHEFVLTGRPFKKFGVRTLDIAKRLLDYGFHAPTIYFPLIVSEALMIEPTETETKETLEAFADALLKIAQEAKENPELLHEAPHNTPVRRLNDAYAAKNLDVRWKPPEKAED
ncbi:MAG: aminomethyl-transferring glycine dehydrogenase subunit GcvPB [Candidatus Hydrothermota bacterium]|nr:MAG: aminomethyl-transferring glycine dehydrogenase subunit GcvPB [Candidatus Hydrothermae bacterium]